MRVLHVTPSYAPAYVYGGPIVSLEGVVTGLSALGIEQRVITTNANGVDVLATPRGWTRRNGVPICYVRRWWPPDVTPAVLPVAVEHSSWADIVHVSGVFCVPSVLGLMAASAADKPVVLSIHGALQPGAMETKTEQKRAWLQLFRGLYDQVDFFHATAAHESAAIRRTFGEHRRIVEIPNGTPTIADEEVRSLHARHPHDSMLIGMLGRLHPIKAVDRVLEALAVLHRRGIPARLEFAGPIQDQAYGDQLIRQAETLGLARHFALVGPRFGDDQRAFYSRCAVLVVASHSENFSNVVIEALNVETPVVASLGTPWSELPARGCGAWVENKPEPLADAIAPFLTSPELRRTAGIAGRALTQEKYTWPTVAHEMAETYKDVIRFHRDNRTPAKTASCRP